MASRGLNKVTLLGNLGHSPKFKKFDDGNATASISLATPNSIKDKDGNVIDKTEWHNVIFYGKLAEIVEKYVGKGSKVYISGSLRTRKWEDKTGASRQTTEIVANDLIMLDSRNSKEAVEQESSPDAVIDEGTKKELEEKISKEIWGYKENINHERTSPKQKFNAGKDEKFYDDPIEF